MVSIFKYAQQILRWLELLFLVQVWKEKFIIFHKINKFSSNITQVHIEH
jgi:hypothetical protein